MSDHSLDYFDEEFFTPISESALKFRAVSAACLELGSYQLGQVQNTAKISTHKGLVALDDICPVVPLAPSQLSALYFHCDADLRELVKAIDAVLLNCADHDSSYTPSAFLWKCKYLRHAQLSEVHVSLFRDPCSIDHHIIEVKQILGEGSRCSSTLGLFQALKVALLADKHKAAAAPPRKGGRIARSAPSLSRASSSSGACGSSVDDFLRGVEPVFAMASSSFKEPRVEAAKMLFDLASEDSRYLVLPRCVDMCCAALSALVLDEDFEDVRQMAVLALLGFLRKPCYAEAFVLLPALEYVASLVANCSSAEMSYECAQMRRECAECLVLLLETQPKAVAQVLMSLGFEDEFSWQSHANLLRDQRTRESADVLAGCFC